jgi:zinc finger protein DZIP1
MLSNLKLPPAEGNISQTAGFCFKQRHGKLNWSQIREVNFDEIAQTGDIEMLQTVLENATYSVLDRSDLERFGDAAALKLFKLSQLGVEYLLYIQNTLFSQNEALQESFKSLSDSSASIQDTIKSQEKEIQQLKEELIQKRKAVSTYQQILRHPATANVLNKVMVQANAVKCRECGKMFMSESYLEQHVIRRHSQPEQKQEDIKVQEINLIMENMKNFMNEQIKFMADTQNRKLQSLQRMFDREISELYNKQKDLESFRVQSATTRTPTPNKDAQIMKMLLDETKREKEYMQSLMQERALRFKDYEQKLKRFKEENFQLAKQKQELENSLSSIPKQDIPRSPPKQLKTTKAASLNIEGRPETPIRPFSGYSDIQSARPISISTVRGTTPQSNAGDLESDESGEEEAIIHTVRIIPKTTSNAGELESDVPSDEEFERESIEEDTAVKDISIQIERAELKLKDSSIEEIVLSPGNKKIDLEAELSHGESKEEYMEVKEAYESFRGDQQFKLNKVMNLIGITENSDKRYEYLAKQLLKTVENVEELKYDHPLVEEFSNKFIDLKARHTNLRLKCLKALSERPESASQTHTYKYGIKSIFEHNPLLFEQMKENLKLTILHKAETVALPEVKPEADSMKSKLLTEMVHLFTNLKADKPHKSSKPPISFFSKEVLDSISERKESQESSVKQEDPAVRLEELEDIEEEKSVESTPKSSIISTPIPKIKHSTSGPSSFSPAIKHSISNSTSSTVS